MKTSMKIYIDIHVCYFKDVYTYHCTRHPFSFKKTLIDFINKYLKTLIAECDH